MEAQLYFLNDRLVEVFGIGISDIQVENEAKDYSGCHFKIGDLQFKYRKAKVTPKKIGQFVALWKRNAAGKTEPYHIDDPFDFYIVETQYGDQSGCFIFSKSVLVEREILSKENSEGKRGFRVYPIWDTPDNKQAIMTKNWQVRFFHRIEGSSNQINPHSLNTI
ncbi:MepB family protein [Sphingobacterium paucimobilis]|uniref:MepB family protein n=1 Tax=Sphingobacterium paucimobilis HER1398 TaxID=1346330 RepID=U2HUX7_9SPHI|nr:MepB family protein [Sphingobacterium paucimobilis]ERJ59065.1 hypothetical protein M472_09805 [Sphingobacterium paucimobilis HER1398]